MFHLELKMKQSIKDVGLDQLGQHEEVVLRHCNTQVVKIFHTDPVRMTATHTIAVGDKREHTYG